MYKRHTGEIFLNQGEDGIISCSDDKSGYLPLTSTPLEMITHGVTFSVASTE